MEKTEMTVSELVELLKNMPKDAEVEIHADLLAHNIQKVELRSGVVVISD